MHNDSNMGLRETCVLCGNEFDVVFVRSGSYPLCSRCWSRDKLHEFDRWDSLRKRMLRRDLPATLSIREWLQIIMYFRNCALCREHGYSVIALLDPAVGMVSGNVFPICRGCAAVREMGMDNAVARVAMLLGQPLELDEMTQENLKLEVDLL